MKGSKEEAYDLLHSKGFEKGPDGVWRKKGSACGDTTGGANPKPAKDKPKRRKRVQSKAKPVCRTIAIVTVRTVRSRDYDGLGAASKHYLDGLRQIGMFEDDSPEHLEVLAVAERVRHFREEETIIELFQVELAELQHSK